MTKIPIGYRQLQEGEIISIGSRYTGIKGGSCDIDDWAMCDIMLGITLGDRTEDDYYHWITPVIEDEETMVISLFRKRMADFGYSNIKITAEKEVKSIRKLDL